MAGGSTPADGGSHRTTLPPGSSPPAAPGPGAVPGSLRGAFGPAWPGFLPPSLGLSVLQKYIGHSASSFLLFSIVGWAGWEGNPLSPGDLQPHNVKAAIEGEIRHRLPSAGNDSHLRTCRLGLAILASSVVLKNEGPERKTCERAECDWLSASREQTDIQEGFPQESMTNYVCGLPRLPYQPEGSTEKGLHEARILQWLLSWLDPTLDQVTMGSSGRVEIRERGDSSLAARPSWMLQEAT